MMSHRKEFVMYAIHKTRESQGLYFALIPFGILVVTAILITMGGLKAGRTFLAVIFWVYAAVSLITLIRTQNLSFLVVVFFQISAGFQVYHLQVFRQPEQKATAITLASITLFFMVSTFALALSKKLRWRGREILELAAAPVEDIGDGYTPRPLPAGKSDLTPQQVSDYANFARRNLLAVIYKGKDRIVFVPVVNGREVLFLLGLKGDYTQETWVSFDAKGNISVNISKPDYLQYKEAYAFDQLCAALANLFVEFINLHSRGESNRIINRLNDLNFSFFS